MEVVGEACETAMDGGCEEALAPGGRAGTSGARGETTVRRGKDEAER